jgi:hypothetical protein
MRLSLDRFSNYRTITARFASTASCGHEVKEGDYIGYNPRAKRTSCAACWRKWQVENAQAEACERELGY